MHLYFALLVMCQLIFRIGTCKQAQRPSIAVIGGGIGAASAVHFLSELFNNNLNIDLYEANKIGGRLATVQLENEEYEAGGSIIHSKNKYMVEFVKLLGLEHRPFRDQKHGIWNGQEIVFEESNSQIFTLAKLIYRYGVQPFKLHSYIRSILDDFSKIYNLQDSGQAFANVTAMLAAMNSQFPLLLEVPIKQHLINLGYSEMLIDELVGATIVTNYGQDTNIHSFVGSVSVAGADAGLWAIKGGNKQVPEHLIYRNKNVNVIPSHVTTIRYLRENNDSFKYEIYYKNEGSMHLLKNQYNIVILATPLTLDQNIHITFEGFPSSLNFLGEYQTTVATFVKADLNSRYFGLDEELDGILNCNSSNAPINSVGRVNPVEGPTESLSNVWKVFSKEVLTRDILNSIFLNIRDIKIIRWKAYPKYNVNTVTNKFKLHNGLYHINAIEWAASAMEMSVIGARNVAILAHKDFQEKLKNLPPSTKNVEKIRNTPSSEL